MIQYQFVLDLHCDCKNNYVFFNSVNIENKCLKLILKLRIFNCNQTCIYIQMNFLFLEFLFEQKGFNSK